MKKITPEEYLKRRQRVSQQIGEGAIAVLLAAKEKIRSKDTEYTYRQDSNFFYLTGFNEPDAALIIAPGREAGESILFCRPRDKKAEIWHGHRLGPEQAVERLNIEQALSIESFYSELETLLHDKSSVFYDLSQENNFGSQLISCIHNLKKKERQGIKAPENIRDIGTILSEMRTIKSGAEVDVMQAACDISVVAHERAIKSCRPGMHEYQLEAEILHEFLFNGAKNPAYNSIVASGSNAASCLHYNANDQVIKDGDLVLIDAGCELNGYASDITRTFPANGHFSTEQKLIYELVLKAQEKAISMIAPGVAWNSPQEIIIRTLTEGLVALGLLSGDINTLINNQAVQQFYMHGFGHFIGLDVHDTGQVKLDAKWRPLVPGMLLTVEPGLYIAPDDDTVDEKWRGIGVRIEDDVLITDNGCFVLSENLPKTVADIEALMCS